MGEPSSKAAGNGKKSDVWEYYEKIKDAPKARCTLCNKELSYRGGTTNLRTHLECKHSLLYIHEVKKTSCSKQSTLIGYAKSQQCSEGRATAITERITNMIALDLKPIRMVEGEGFCELLHYLEPGYKIPCRKHVTKMILKKHESVREKLQSKLNKEATSISLTTDIWSSAATEAYITVSAHYISPEWNLLSCVLETPGMPERHTGQNIADRLAEIADRWAINEKVSVVVHDQAANMECAMDILENDRGWQSMKCTAHCLQLCLKAGLSINTIDRLTGAARKLVGHFKHSVLACEELKKRQAQMELSEHKLIQDCDTRWNSTYYMLKRLVEMRWPVSAVLSCERVTRRSDRYLDLKNDQWTLAEELIKVLEPFEVATTFLSYEENSSLSSTLPVLYGLIDGLNEAPEKEDESLPAAIVEFKRIVAEELTRRWELEDLDTSTPFVLAPLVDPRFKLLELLNERDKILIKAEIVKQMNDFSGKVCTDLESVQATTRDSECEEGEPVRKKPKKVTALDKLLGVEKEEESLTATEELEQYLTEKTVKRKSNPLIWWKENKKRFPQLSKVARCLLNIPATSTPSERIFSVAGLTVNKLRSSLKPKNVDSLVFLNKNLKLF